MQQVFDQKKLEQSLEANCGRPYQQCAISVMDTIADPNITFDEKGISNYYYNYKKAIENHVKNGAEGDKTLHDLIEKVKAEGKGKKYDCITGVSGGVDSTYLTLQMKKMGLRPLVVHFDNSWNSELAVKNVESIISKLGFDLYTLVVDWNEFKDLQLAYLKAGVVDIEALTDHAIIGTLYRLAAENNIKYIFSGANVVTENTLPSAWVFNKSDHVNIKAIHKAFGSIPLKTYPFFSTKEKQYYIKAKGIASVYPLNYMTYNKQAVKNVIIDELDWRDYGGKHYESVWTRFYQGYILPTKFNIDKRKAHLSDLIFGGQITKAQALAELALPIYDPIMLQQDYEFVLKKFDLTDAEFKAYINAPRREHTDFEVERSLADTYWLLGIIKKTRNYIRNYVEK